MPCTRPAVQPRPSRLVSSDLLVSGGGSIAVATTALLEQAQALERLERELGDCVRRLAGIERGTTAATGAHAARAEQAMDDARARLASAAGTSGLLAAGLRSSADGYGIAESLTERLCQSLAAELGVGLGFFSSTVGLLMLPGILSAIAGGAAVYSLSNAVDPTSTRRVVGSAAAWLDENKAILSDPRFVALVRLSVMSADDFGGGLLRLPPPLIRLLGDDGLGLLGLKTSAAAIMSAAGLAGGLRESPVTVRRASSARAVPVAGFADRAARVPTGSAQVRIDRYVQTGRPDRFEVYLGGTIDFSPVATTEPWDMTSNVSAIAGEESGAYRAVAEALDAAGVEPGSEIVVTGYSQGGLVASLLAASGDYDVRGLYTLGAPAGQVPVPPEIPWVAVEHTDDIVPAVGGSWASADPVLVRREAFSSGPPDPGFAFPAHQLDQYRATAVLVDAAEETRLVSASASFGDVVGGADRVESTWYTARRTSNS